MDNITNELIANIQHLTEDMQYTFLGRYELEEVLSADWKFLGSGVSRVCIEHIPSGRVFKVAKTNYDIDCNLKEFKLYRKQFRHGTKQYFAKPKGIWLKGRVMEVAKAKGHCAKETDKHVKTFTHSAYDFAYEIADKFGIGDMHYGNFFIHGIYPTNITIVDYAY